MKPTRLKKEHKEKVQACSLLVLTMASPLIFLQMAMKEVQNSNGLAQPSNK